MLPTDVNKTNATREAKLFLNYIQAQSVNVESIEKYLKAIEKLQLTLTEQENTILNFAFQNPKSIAFIDCGLSLFNPQSNLKKRLIVATSIMESSPQSFNSFLNSKKLNFPIVRLFLLGIQTVFTTVIAFLLFKLKGWK